YYDQLKDTFSASTAASGTAMTSSNDVTASYVQFGSTVNDASKIYDGTNLGNIWIDRASTATLTTNSTGTRIIERWPSNAPGTPPSLPAIPTRRPSDLYYDQLKDTFSASTAAGGTAMTSSNDVTASYVQFGSTVNDASKIYDGTNLGNVW